MLTTTPVLLGSPSLISIMMKNFMEEFEMQKWEYKTFRADRDDYKGFFKGVKNEKFESDINDLGKEGWEFVGNGLNDGLNAMILVFKRPLQG